VFRHILVPTDGSPASTRAARQAIALAHRLRARLTVFHAIPAYRTPGYIEGFVVYPETYSPAEYRRRTEADSGRMLARIAARAAAAKVRCSTRTVQADAVWKAIIATARSQRCDLIVMASHGRKGVEALILGSETTRVLTRSRVPVLVCR
jgi:nucleotide-binding universal stress UspA family protein